MKNRAKCKLCESIIESHHIQDYVSCKCGEISIDGGDTHFRCAAINWENFLRVDDEGNEIIPTIKDSNVKPLDNEIVEEAPKLTKTDLVKILQDMIKNIEDLPPEAMTVPVNQYDLMGLMMILVAIFKEQE